MTARWKYVSVLAILLFTSVFIFLPKISLAADSCTASVSPSTIQANTIESPFTFSITNTGTGTINYIKITRPSANFTLVNLGVPSWDEAANSQLVELTGNTIAPSASTDITYWATIGSEEAASANWTVEANSNGIISCTGSLGTAISGIADVLGPGISNEIVSGTTSSSVSVNWTTNENATSKVIYGLTQAYGSQVESASLVTTHSLAITGLSANTTYHYRLSSTDASGNVSFGAISNFTTSAAAATAAPAATATPTPATTTTTATPTPRPSDARRPVVTLTTDFTDSYDIAPTISGTAIDNNTITKIEYSIDGGSNWLPVGTQSSADGTQRSFTFSFTPELFEDGNYEILARATDSFTNIGESDPATLVIDRLPPRVGGNLLSMGPLPLLPNKDGVIITMANLAQRITMSAVGGPTSIDLLANNRMFSLGRSVETGLWNGTINFDTPGIYHLTTRAIDGAGNKTNRDLNTVAVLRSGKITDRETSSPITKGKVTIYYQDPEAKIWTLWDAKSFGQENPQNLDEEGTYEYFLPPGTYYLQIKAFEYSTLTSQIFSIARPTPFNADFTLKKARQLKLGPFAISLPDFSSQRSLVKITTPEITSDSAQSSLLGQELANFSLPTQDDTFTLNDLNGKASVLTFINSWSPPAVEQISIIDDLFFNREIEGALISTQENSSKIAVFVKRGEYKVPIAVDADGELVEEFKLTSLPTHYFLSRTGVIEKIVTGVLTSSEVKDILANID